MKKKLIVIIFLLALFVILVVILKNPKEKEEVKVDTKPTTLVEGLIVSNSFETKVLNPDDTYVKFDVTYPYFKNADKDFNLKIQTLIENQIEDDNTLSKENWQARYNTQIKGDNIPKVPKNDEDKFSFFSNFTIVQSNSSYISFILKYGGFSGGAHDYENNLSFNYDVKNQKVIELKDIFPNDPNYLTYLSTQSRESLKKTFATVSDNDREQATAEEIKAVVKDIVTSIESGTEPKEENFSVFTFIPDKIKIYFAQYQVGPYVIGMPEVEVNRK